MADNTLTLTEQIDRLTAYYARAHKMGSSDPDNPSKRTMAGDTVETLQKLVEENDRLRAQIAAGTEVVRDFVNTMFANIPLRGPDLEWDPHDQFKACAVDRAERADRMKNSFLEAVSS